MKDMISVIIPVYNRQDVIAECVQSIQAQSHQNFEIILIDDGSADQTLDICKKLANEDSRIKLLAMEHAGVSAARNRGLDAAVGEYVFFVDSDDVIHPLPLESLIGGMKKSDAAIAGTGIINVAQKNWGKVRELIAQDPGPGETTHQSHPETLHAVFCTVSPINLIGGVMMRRDLIGDTRFNPDLFIGEDFYFIYQNLIKGASTVFLKQKWYYCRIHANNSSWNYSYSGFWTRFHRRELVWRSEEAFGRAEYANRQKQEAFSIFLGCLKKNPIHGVDSRKMREVMKDYRDTLLPALKPGDKVRYFLAVHMPAAYRAVVQVKQKWKR